MTATPNIEETALVDVREGGLPLSNSERRIKILDTEKFLAQLPGTKFGDQECCPLTHKFADGIYVREIFLPKGTLLVGKIHRYSHPRFLMFGELYVFTEFTGWKFFRAPLCMISEAGSKRVTYALEDSQVVTVHATDKTNLDEIEEEVIAPSYEELEKERNPECHS